MSPEPGFARLSSFTSLRRSPDTLGNHRCRTFVEKPSSVQIGNTEMLKVEGVNQYYGGSHILRNVGFEAKLGEVTVILGRNGVGKTTLLKSLMGVVPVRTGSITLDGAAITRDTPYERVRKGVGSLGASWGQPPA